MVAAIAALDEIHSSNYGISNIADSLKVSSPAISRTITTLENKGYAVRYIDKTNRRNTGVRLTEQGAAVFESEKERLSEFMNCVVEKMGEEKLAQLLNLSKELLFNVEKEIKLRKNE